MFQCYGLDDRGLGFDSRLELGISLFTTAFRTALGPTSLLSNGYQGLFPWELSGRGVKLTTRLYLVPRSKNEWGYTSTPPYAFMAWCSVKAQGLYLYIYQMF
jgi:hypothetical protein